MITKYISKNQTVMYKVDYMRQEIDITSTICGQTHDLTIVLLFEETDNNVDERFFYGYQIGKGQLQKPMAAEPDISIDWGEVLHNEITDWFFTTFIFQEDEKNEKISRDVDDTFAKIWDILEEEHLV